VSTTNRYYWVPEQMLYANAGDCLDARPDDGAAVLVVNETAYKDLEQKLARAVRTLEYTKQLRWVAEKVAPERHAKWINEFCQCAEEALAFINTDTQKGEPDLGD